MTKTPSATPSVSVESEERFDYLSDAQARELWGTEDDEALPDGRVRVCEGEWVRIPGGYYFDGSAGLLHPETASEACDGCAVTLAAAPAPNPSPAAKSGEAEALRTNIEAFLDMHRKGVLVPPTPGIPIELLQDALTALATPSPQPADAVREALAEAQRREKWEVEQAKLNGRWLDAGKHSHGWAVLGGILAALTEPAPAGEAVEPVAFRVRRQSDIEWRFVTSIDRFPTKPYEVEPLYAHPAPEDTARLREDLERRTSCNAALEEMTARYHSEKVARESAERERDDARKALETATEAFKSAYFEGFSDARKTSMDAETGWDVSLAAVAADNLTDAEHSTPTIDLMRRIWANLFYDEAEAGYTFQGTLNDVVDWLSARGALPDVAEHDGTRKGNLVSLRCLADERNPTLEEASEAASVLLMCNGADLDFWSKGVLPDELFEEAAKNIQRAARSASREATR